MDTSSICQMTALPNAAERHQLGGRQRVLGCCFASSNPSSTWVQRSYSTSKSTAGVAQEASIGLVACASAGLTISMCIQASASWHGTHYCRSHHSAAVIKGVLCQEVGHPVQACDAAQSTGRRFISVPGQQVF
jgi:hypothetical protein